MAEERTRQNREPRLASHADSRSGLEPQLPGFPWLDRLSTIVRPPASPHCSVDWVAVESELGTALPADFKALDARYGDGNFDGYMRILNPAWLGPETEMGHMRYVRDVRGDCPFPVFPEPGGLLMWGMDDTRLRFFWLTEGPPDGWPVVDAYTDDLQHACRHAMSMTEYLAKVFAREIECPNLPDDWPGDDAVFHAFKPRNKRKRRS